MRLRGIVMAAVVGVALGGSVRADEIVYFTNGTAMAVRSHKVEKGMIRVDLGNNAVMAFPVSMVEKVENAGRNVFRNPAFGPANQALAGSGGDAASPAPDATPLATGRATMPARYRQSASARRRAEMDPEQQLALAQQGNPAPPETSAGPTPAARRMRILGRPSATASNGDGTFRRGDSTVIFPPDAPVGVGAGDTTGQPIMSLGPKARTATEDPGTPPSEGDAPAGDESAPAEPPADPSDDAPPPEN